MALVVLCSAMFTAVVVVDVCYVLRFVFFVLRACVVFAPFVFDFVCSMCSQSCFSDDFLVFADGVWLFVLMRCLFVFLCAFVLLCVSCVFCFAVRVCYTLYVLALCFELC